MKNKIKKVIKGLKKASKLHASQAKTLKSVRIKAGSGEKMKKAGQKGRPTAKHFASAKKTKRT